MADRDKEHQECLIAEAECRARSGLSRAQRWRLEREGRFLYALVHAPFDGD